MPFQYIPPVLGYRLGFNLEVLSYLEGVPWFRDFMKRTFAWQAVDTATGKIYPYHDLFTNPPGVTVPVYTSGDGIGYPNFEDPVMDGRHVINNVANQIDNGLPLGRWRVRYDGEGDDGPGTDVVLEGPNLVTISVEAGHLVYNANAGCDRLRLRIRTSKAQGVGNGPVRNVRIYGPDLVNDPSGLTAYDDGSGGYFRPEVFDYLESLMHVTDDTIRIRMGGWCQNQTCGFSDRFPYSVTRWEPFIDDEAQVTDVRYTMRNDLRRFPVPKEVIVAFANEMQARTGKKVMIWWSTAHPAYYNTYADEDMEYQRWNVAWADYFAANLHEDVTLVLECGNEFWNVQIAAGYWVSQETGKNWHEPEFQQLVAESIHKCFETWIDRFTAAGRQDDLKLVVCGWITQPSFLSGVVAKLSGIDSSYPAKLFGIAPSFYTATNDTSGFDGNTTVDDIFYQVRQGLNLKTIPGLKAHKQLADQYGCYLLCYEGGVSVIPGRRGLDWTGAANACHHDPEMFNYYKDELLPATRRSDTNVYIPFHYGMVAGDGGIYGTFNLMFGYADELGDPLGTGRSPKWDAWEYIRGNAT